MTGFVTNLSATGNASTSIVSADAGMLFRTAASPSAAPFLLFLISDKQLSSFGNDFSRRVVACSGPLFTLFARRPF
jgi:hypothetical protein